ncbi:hypothetical protein HPB49_016456 [Dermacentor silvarum]|uniref:Uncharacterized protein n=1 Tax=Dermacentor silvarum TaxID=543639 RepID=A0ACB8CYI1_DERSI|nr:hypothetical protein HPB49_016456 [Dermacentor silvarum]
MQVRGRYCAIVDPAVEEVWLKVHWVPFHISNASLRRALQEYGTVKSVSSQKWSKQEIVATSTTRHVRLCLKEGLEVKDLPHLWCYQDRRFLIVVPGRPPLCLKCGTIGHLNRACTAQRCSTCNKYGHNECEFVDTPATGNIQVNVPTKPGEMPETPAAVCQIDHESESQKATAPATEETAEHPHEVLTEDEPVTGNAQVNENVPMEPGEMLVTPTAVCETEHESESQQGTPVVADETTAQHPHEVVSDAETGITD